MYVYSANSGAACDDVANGITLRTLEEGKATGGDDSSDVSILEGGSSGNKKNTILRTREVAIEYDSRSASSGTVEDGFEMIDHRRPAGGLTAPPVTKYRVGAGDAHAL